MADIAPVEDKKRQQCGRDKLVKDPEHSGRKGRILDKRRPPVKVIGKRLRLRPEKIMPIMSSPENKMKANAAVKTCFRPRALAAAASSIKSKLFR